MARRNYELRSLSEADRTFVRGLVIHEDAALLGLNKPAGLPVQTRNPDDRTLDALLGAFARSNGKRPRLVHRLDAQTSGIIVAAKTQPAAAALSEAFASRNMAKTYLAIVSGAPFDAPSGRIEIPLSRYRPRPELELMRAARPGDEAQAAATDWRVLASGAGCTLVALFPETGRMHQLRAHLSLVGRPIVGDPWYGGASTLGPDDAPRMMLHALALAGPHPAGGQFSLRAPAPADFAEAAIRSGVGPLDDDMLGQALAERSRGG